MSLLLNAKDLIFKNNFNCREKKVDIYLFTQQMPKTARAGAGPNQGPGNQSPTCRAGAHVLEPSLSLAGN